MDIAYDAWVELHEWELWGWRLLDSLPAVSSKELASNGGEPVQGVVKHLDDNTMLLAPVGVITPSGRGWEVLIRSTDDCYACPQRLRDRFYLTRGDAVEGVQKLFAAQHAVSG